MFWRKENLCFICKHVEKMQIQSVVRNSFLSWPVREQNIFHPPSELKYY